MSQKSDKTKLGRKDLKNLLTTENTTKINRAALNVTTAKINTRLKNKSLEHFEAMKKVENIKTTSVNIAKRETETPGGSKESPLKEVRQKGGEIVVIETNRKSFKVLYVLTIIVGLVMVGLMAFWLCNYLDGFDMDIKFNWHPLLMTIGFIFLYGNAILVYRGFRKSRKQNLKTAHTILHLIVLIIALFALVPVFKEADANLYSIHSWLGIFAIVLFIFQFLAGFMAYMLPFFKDYYKMAYMPVHIYFGSFIFVIGICSAMMGLVQKIQFEYGKDYAKLEEAAVVANVCGVLMIIFGALVLYLSTFPLYKRKPLTVDYFTDIVNNYLEDKFRSQNFR